MLYIAAVGHTLTCSSSVVPARLALTRLADSRFAVRLFTLRLSVSVKALESGSPLYAIGRPAFFLFGAYKEIKTVFEVTAHSDHCRPCPWPTAKTFCYDNSSAHKRIKLKAVIRILTRRRPRPVEPDDPSSSRLLLSVLTRVRSLGLVHMSSVSKSSIRSSRSRQSPAEHACLLALHTVKAYKY